MILVAQLVNVVYWVVMIFLFARVIFSWVRVDPYHPVWGPLMRITYQVTEPLLAPIRRMLPGMSGIDLSPMILWFIMSILRSVLFNILI